jgi:DNA-binding LacI/PurR family transcriptional regulator
VSSNDAGGADGSSRRRPTLEEVAAQAGVGRGTASRAINGSPGVSARARAAVQAAVESLGYVPNPAARALVTQRTGAIAIVIAESDDRIFGEAYFARIVRGCAEVVSAAGGQLVLPVVRRDDRKALAEFLRPMHVDGIVLLDQETTSTLAEEIWDTRLPVVHGGRPVGGLRFPYVDTDNAEGAKLAVGHLLSRGRRRVAMITGSHLSTHSNDRLEGYRTTLEAAGLPVEEELIAEGDFDEATGERAMRVLLGRRPELDAVFAGNDAMAVGALRVLREAGRHVPDDVAVVGFDDAPFAATSEPALTTVNQPTEEVGRRLARMLLEQIEDPGREPVPVILPTTLVVRKSS